MTLAAEAVTATTTESAAEKQSRLQAEHAKLFGELDELGREMLLQEETLGAAVAAGDPDARKKARRALEILREPKVGLDF